MTKEALAAEERGDFKEALDQYKQVLCGVWVIEPLCAQCDCLGRWCAVCVELSNSYMYSGVKRSVLLPHFLHALC